MLRRWNRPKLWLAAGFLLIVVILVGIPIANQQVNRWVDSGGLTDMLDRQTSKGLKLKAHYTGLKRDGWLGMRGDVFDGQQGEKTIVTLKTYNLSASFNPWGVFLRRWQVDDLHMTSGTVMLQKTEGSPSKGPPSRPWYLFLWPDRVYLANTKVDYANILWHLQDKESGIYGTFLEITPNGRDFEYDAKGGIFATPMTPKMEVRHAHMLIRKPRLWCSEFILNDDPAHPGQTLSMTGEAGLQEDRSMKMKFDLNSLNIAPWMKGSLKGHVTGHFSGHFDYASTGTGLETATGEGNLELIGGVLRDLVQVQKYVKLTESPDPGDMELKVCKAHIGWKEGALTIDQIEAESPGVFRVTGGLTIAKDKSLSGQLQVGLNERYIRWLPTAKSAIFTRREGSYHFTTVHFYGTSKKPQQDLTERVTKELGKSPFVAMKLFFNQAGDWFGGD